MAGISDLGKLCFHVLHRAWSIMMDPPVIHPNAPLQNDSHSRCFTRGCPFGPLTTKLRARNTLGNTFGMSVGVASLNSQYLWAKCVATMQVQRLGLRLQRVRRSLLMRQSYGLSFVHPTSEAQHRSFPDAILFVVWACAICFLSAHVASPFASVMSDALCRLQGQHLCNAACLIKFCQWLHCANSKQHDIEDQPSQEVRLWEAPPPPPPPRGV